MPTKTETLLSSLKINKLTRSQFLTAKAADEVDLDNEFYMTGEVLGEGDMLKEVYDKNGNGIVDNAEKVNGLTVLTAVPANAKFTDTTYSTFKGATSSSTGGAGLVPAPSSGQQTLFLRGDGIWASTPQPTVNNSTITITQNGISKGAFGLNQTNGLTIPLTDTTYSQATSTTLGLVKIGYTSSGKNYPVSLSSEGKMFVNVPWTDTNTTYNVATQSANGLLSSTDKTKLDGIASGANNYSLPAASSTIRGGVKLGYSTNGKNYAVQATNEQLYVNVPWTDTNTTYSAFKAATASAAGGTGLVPAPAAGKQTSFLRGDGTWVIPSQPTVNNPTITIKQAGTTKGTFTLNQSGAATIELTDNNTTYSAVSTTAAGLAPKLSGTATQYLNGAGQWTTPPNTTYGVVSTSANGLAPKLPGNTSKFFRGDGTWASVPSGGVTGVKGNTETTYRTGQVNLTADNIGALPISGEATIQDDLTINILNNYLMLKNGEIILDSCAIESSSIYVSNSSINFNNTILTIDTASGFNYDGGFY